MKYIVPILLISVVFACKPRKITDISVFKTGQFTSYLKDSRDSSYFYRTHHFQIETYKGKTDSFAVYWKSDFEYELRKVNPKSKLDSLPFIVKITGIKENTYTFKGHYQGSNFKQEGTTIKKE